MAEAVSAEHARDYAGIALQYAREAHADRYKRKHCKWVRLAAQRHLNDLKRQRRKAFEYEFSEWHANDVCDFVEKFEHIEGQWETPTIQLEPVQIFMLCTIFGWRRKSDGLRRFTQVYIEVARKAAKSTLTAPVAHYVATCEGEVGPQIIIGATTGDQALKVFGPAKKMAEKSADFRNAFDVEVWAKSITYGSSGGFMQTINAKSTTQDGWNPYMSILDELHAHKDRGLYDVMRSADGARKSPLMWMITTAGYNVSGVCYQQHKFVKDVLQGTIEADHYFGIIFSLDEGDDPFDERKWIKANPLLGITPSLESLKRYAIEAKESPESESEFKTKRLNIWLNSKSAYLSVPQWQRNGGAVDLEQLKTVPVFGGIDLAATEDTAAFALVGFIGDRLHVRVQFYLPEDTLQERVERSKVPYREWVERRYITATPGEVTDYAFIQRDIENALTDYQISEIGFDAWNATQLVTNLLALDAPMVQVVQGPRSFNAAMVELKRLVKSRRINHGGNPVLEWMASNMVARRDENMNRAPDKKRSGEKIDGMVAMLMGLARLMAHRDVKPSTYEQSDEGLLIL